jgi:hypothetical protein
MEKVIAQFNRERPSFANTKQKFLEWYSCFESEVEGQVYMLVLPHRIPYWISAADQLQGVELSKLLAPLLAGFPNAVYDAELFRL